jgi:hypothetical protein
MRLTIHFSIKVFSFPQFCIPQPKHPHGGWTTDVLMMYFVTTIVGVLMLQHICRVYTNLWLQIVRKTVRNTVNAIWCMFFMKIGKCAAPSRFTCPIAVQAGISPYLFSQFAIVQNITLRDLMVCLLKKTVFESKYKLYDTKIGFEYKHFFFDTTYGYSDETGMNNFRSLKAPLFCDETWIPLTPVLPVPHALVADLISSGKEDKGATYVAAFDSASLF